MSASIEKDCEWFVLLAKQVLARKEVLRTPAIMLECCDSKFDLS